MMAACELRHGRYLTVAAIFRGRTTMRVSFFFNFVSTLKWTNIRYTCKTITPVILWIGSQVTLRTPYGRDGVAEAESNMSGSTLSEYQQCERATVEGERALGDNRDMAHIQRLAYAAWSSECHQFLSRLPSRDEEDVEFLYELSGMLIENVRARTRGSCPDLGRTTRGRRDGGGFGNVGGCGDGGGFGEGGGFVDGGGFGTVASVAVAQAAATPEVDLFLEEQR
ncbi:unnamed protein product [Toxocara canis]|uniref:Retrotransposon protein n=1 Tax=Toxocara canis TaxID=6265 RepID=A0A183VH04_TOXCA|nr:unnamed protein product [Toxocara canis]